MSMTFVRSRLSRASRAMLPILMLFAMAVVAAACALLDAQAPAKTPSQAPSQSGRRGYQLFRAFQDRFTFEYPVRDWEPIAGGTSSLAALTQKRREAAVVIEYQPLRLALAPNEIDEHFAKLEADPVTMRQPGSSEVAVRLTNVGANRVVVVDFTRKGIAGPERVRQYSFPLGAQLYRLVCSAPAGTFEKYEAVFTAMVESFRATAGPASASSGR